MYMYINLPVNSLVRLSPSSERDSQSQEMFLPPSADNQTRSHGTEGSFVCISKNLRPLRWLNEQVKRALRYDTRPVPRLFDFQV